jgi:hypothetical protein
MLITCAQAIQQGTLIQRQSRQDKEFPFQNWFKARLEGRGVDFDEPGRNTYPDFRLVHLPLGYELKGLGFPGRANDYDCNSQIPHGVYRGRHIIYVFGRYPSQPDANQYGIYDLVLCHGSLLNANDSYVHVNKSVGGMGSYGDILLRDRKMYVAPTPFGLLEGVERQITLLLPAEWPAPDGVSAVGQIQRHETSQLMTGYHFDLLTHELSATYTENPTAEDAHSFTVYRQNPVIGPQVTLRQQK